MWAHQWPVKPDVVFEAGNFALTNGDTHSRPFEDLMLVSASAIVLDSRMKAGSSRPEGCPFRAGVRADIDNGALPGVKLSDILRWVGAYARPRFMCEVEWRGLWVGLQAGRSSAR
jgi:hypothetical protein